MESLDNKHRTATFAIPLAFGLTLLGVLLNHPALLSKQLPYFLWEVLRLSDWTALVQENFSLAKGIPFLVLLLGILAYYPRKEISKSLPFPWGKLSLGMVLYWGIEKMLQLMNVSEAMTFFLELWGVLLGLLYLLLAGVQIRRRWFARGLLTDRFNTENESFAQAYPKLETPYSINIPYRYTHQGRIRKSWINLINPFRSTLVIGTTGSGKSFGIIEEVLRQWVEKGYPLALYDFKFPTQSRIAYNYLNWYAASYQKQPEFHYINLDDPAYSHCCNPLDPQYLTKQQDAINAAIALLYNINRKWVEKKGEFFVDSPIVYVAALIWFLKITSEKTGHYLCTLPHVLVLAQQSPKPLFQLLQSEPEVKLLINTFKDALDLSALEQLAGQTGSANIGLSQLVSKELFFIMGQQGFSLWMNHPDAPKILCFGNHPARKEAYAAPLGMYLSTLIRVVNRQGQLPSGLFLDELPTLYILGLDDFIATVRSNKVATLMGIQNLAQLARDYGQRVAEVIAEISGNIIVGQVTFTTAKRLSELFGKIKQERFSVNTGHRQQSTNRSTQMDAVLPPSKLAQLSQGTFAGILADSHALPLPNKLFHGKTIMDMALKEKQEDLELPLIHDFTPQSWLKIWPFWEQCLNEIPDALVLGLETDDVIEQLSGQLWHHAQNLSTSLEVSLPKLVDKSLLCDVLSEVDFQTFGEGAIAWGSQAFRAQFRQALLEKVTERNKENILHQNFERIETEIQALFKNQSPDDSPEKASTSSETDEIQEIDYFWEDGTPSETFVPHSGGA